MKRSYCPMKSCNSNCAVQTVGNDKPLHPIDTADSLVVWELSQAFPQKSHWSFPSFHVMELTSLQCHLTIKANTDNLTHTCPAICNCVWKAWRWQPMTLNSLPPWCWKSSSPSFVPWAPSSYKIVLLRILQCLSSEAIITLKLSCLRNGMSTACKAKPFSDIKCQLQEAKEAIHDETAIVDLIKTACLAEVWALCVKMQAWAGPSSSSQCRPLGKSKLVHSWMITIRWNPAEHEFE